MTTIAEFVESEAVVGILRNLGVECGQGFHFGRPGPVQAERVAGPPIGPGARLASKL